ncbi:MAG TPA: transporter substrate-binding domain-containing protein [Actinomycetota bacterium]|nr:transporter substrate-binding domain-containing protein [Actinomycetota bacterium]
MRAVGGGKGRLLALVVLVALAVGTELPAAPFWIGDDYDSLTGGFEVDLAKEIAKRLGLGDTRFVEMPFTELVAGQQCPCDIDFSQVTITPDRAKVVKFTEPYFDANQGILVKKGTKVTSLADAKHLKWAPSSTPPAPLTSPTPSSRPPSRGCSTARWTPSPR